jgi:cell division protein ZapA
MKEEISIKVNIADVVYPLKVVLDDEENVRKAAKLINEKVRLFRDDYPAADKVNLLSMVALQFATELLLYREKNWIEDDGITNDLKQISELLSGAVAV